MPCAFDVLVKGKQLPQLPRIVDVLMGRCFDNYLLALADGRISIGVTKLSLDHRR